MDEGADTINGPAVVIAAVQLVENGKMVDVRVSRTGTEGTIAASIIILSGIQRPVTGPDGLRVVNLGLSLSYPGKDDDDHITKTVAVGIIRLK